MRKTETKKICDKRYDVSQMDAKRALSKKAILIEFLSPLFPLLVETTKPTNGKTKWQDDVIKILKNYNNFTTIINSLSSERFIDFFVEMCEEAFVDTKKVNFNEQYTGNLKEAYLCFLFVIEVNYGNFLQDVIGINPFQILMTSINQKL